MSASAAAAPSGVAYVKTSAGLDFGRVWSSILSVCGDGPPKSVLFASPGSRQGASTMAAGIALTAAQANPDLRLGLLDFNLRSPSMDKLFQIPVSPGAVDGLSGSADVGELGYAQGVHSNLLVIPAGQLSGDPLTLLRREKAAALVESLRGRLDILLADTSAVNDYPDAQVIAALFDATVLVLDMGRARRETVAKAKQIVQTSRGKLVGTVLNRRSHPVPKILYSRS